MNLDFDADLQKRYESDDLICGSLEELKVGGEYFVICQEETIGGYEYIYLPEVNPECGYPPPYPIELFDFVRSSYPENWLEHETKDHKGNKKIRRSFPAWASDDMFFERLVDEGPEILETYKQQLLISKEKS